MPLDLLEPIAPPAPVPEPEPIPPQPQPEFSPILATTPTTTPATMEEVFNQWFLAALSLNRRDGTVYDLETHWDQGNETKLSGVRTNYIIRDLLSQQSLYDNPEIAEIAPQLMAALAAVGKRKGVL